MTSSERKKQQRRARLAAAERRRRDESDGGAGPKGVAKLRASLGIDDTAAAEQRRDPARAKVHARTAERGDRTREEPKQSFSERAAQRRAATNQPPLGLSLGAIMVMGFSSMLLLQGLAGLSKGSPLLGALFLGVGALFLASAFFTYRRKGWAWAVCVLGTGLATGALVGIALFLPADLLQVNGTSIGRTSVLLWSVFFLCPLLLLLLPGSRAELEWPHREPSA